MKRAPLRRGPSFFVPRAARAGRIDVVVKTSLKWKRLKGGAMFDETTEPEPTPGEPAPEPEEPTEPEE